MSQIKTEKVIRNGMVAVLVSPGFGAGWSTWNGEVKDWLLFDKAFVEFAERNARAEEVEAYIERTAGEQHVYCGGWPCIVEWVAEGTLFYIHEYDGSESIRFGNDFTRA